MIKTIAQLSLLCTGIAICIGSTLNHWYKINSLNDYYNKIQCDLEYARGFKKGAEDCKRYMEEELRSEKAQTELSNEEEA